MGDQSAIEWTDATWNPIRGCSRVSEGCRNCYAERVAARFSNVGQPYHGLATMSRRGPDTKGGRGHLVKLQWTGRVAFVESVLDAPLRWKRPRRIFVNSMGDLFHEKVPDEWIDMMFAIMGLAWHHTFQILTKRPERMLAYLTGEGVLARIAETMQTMAKKSPPTVLEYPVGPGAEFGHRWFIHPAPMKHVWLGVSVEEQATADERIPLLLQTPAAIRWVSYEPALGPVDLPGLAPKRPDVAMSIMTPRLDWVVVGGESGPGARPFDLAWARSTIAQCRAAGVPVFVKQLGAKPRDGNWYCHSCRAIVAWEAQGPWSRERCYLCGSTRVQQTFVMSDRKGGDMAEWPEDLRVREYPV